MLSPQPPKPNLSENEPIRLSSVEPPIEADSSEPLPVPVTIPSGTAVKSPHPHTPSAATSNVTGSGSHPLATPTSRTAATRRPHTPSAATSNVTGSGSHPLATPTSSTAATRRPHTPSAATSNVTGSGSHPLATPTSSTAATRRPHTPSAATSNVTGSGSHPLATPTSSAAVRLLGSVQTLGRSVHEVKPLPPPPQVPTFQEYLRRQAAQGTPSVCVPMATGSARKFSALSRCNGVTPSRCTGHTNLHLSSHTPSHFSGHTPSYFSGHTPSHFSGHTSSHFSNHTPSFARTVGRLAFEDNFTSPAPQPLPPVTHSNRCDTTFTITSPQSTVSTRCSDISSRDMCSVSHDHLRGLPVGAPLSSVTNHTQQERKVSKSVNLGEWCDAWLQGDLWVMSCDVM